MTVHVNGVCSAYISYLVNMCWFLPWFGARLVVRLIRQTCDSIPICNIKETITCLSQRPPRG